MNITTYYKNWTSIEKRKEKEITIPEPILTLQTKLHLVLYLIIFMIIGSSLCSLHTNTKKIKTSVMPSGIATWQVRNQIELERI
jgi:lipopolysaccharide export LptBFGC system permease protein LptF